MRIQSLKQDRFGSVAASVNSKQARQCSDIEKARSSSLLHQTLLATKSAADAVLQALRAASLQKV
jgi:hypothetical protein